MCYTKPNKCYGNGIFFYEDTISLRTLFLNFAKLQIPQITCDDLSFPFIWFCVATIGVCVFGALTSVGALFYFYNQSFMAL